MGDTSVVCWGYDNYGQAGAPAGAAVGPTSVLLAEGGAPLSGIVDLAGDGTGGPSMCAKTSDLAVVCWGRDASNSPYPVAYKNAASNAAIGIEAPLSYSPLGLGYIDPDGLLTGGGDSTGPVPPCTNLGSAMP
jgi:hypothetical protein